MEVSGFWGGWPLAISFISSFSLSPAFSFRTGAIRKEESRKHGWGVHNKYIGCDYGKKFPSATVMLGFIAIAIARLVYHTLHSAPKEKVQNIFPSP